MGPGQGQTLQRRYEWSYEVQVEFVDMRLGASGVSKRVTRAYVKVICSHSWGWYIAVSTVSVRTVPGTRNHRHFRNNNSSKLLI